MNRVFVSHFLIIDCILLLAGVIFVLSGCNGESTETGGEPVAEMSTPVDPAIEEPSEITPYAVAPFEVDLAALESEARDLRNQLLQKREEIEKLIAEKASIPLAEQMSEEAKDLAEQIMEYREDIAQMSQELDQSIKELQEAGKDTLSLEMDE